MVIHHSDLNFRLSLGNHKDWVIFEEQENELTMQLDEDKIQEYIQTELASKIETKKQDIIISKDTTTHKPVIQGIGKNGISIDTKALTKQIYENIIGTNNPITVPTLRHQAQFIDKTGQFGEKQLLGEGISNFAGSPHNRVYNIKHGLESLQNIMLEKDAQFSFLKLVGDITIANGYKEELVIKQGGKQLKKEAGGGICQVSSTVFRAALNTGMRIDTWRNHSRLVSYYQPVGLDATIYGPTQDFVFTNNTPSSILIQNEVDEVTGNVIFRIWGDDDGRKIDIQGPVKYGYVPIPEPVYIDNPNLPKGEVVRKQKGVNGISANWTRKVVWTDGREEEKIFKSWYRAVPAVYERN